MPVLETVEGDLGCPEISQSDISHEVFLKVFDDKAHKNLVKFLNEFSGHP